MKSIRQWWMGAAGAATLVAIIGAGAVMAQTPSTTPSASPTVASSTSPSVVPGTSNASPATPAAGTSTGAFKSNEDPTHEAGESAAREAQEDAGQRPTGPPPSGAPMTPGSSQTPSGAN